MFYVALFVRAWIEILMDNFVLKIIGVALFVRAWIEIGPETSSKLYGRVALFVRAWIEIKPLASAIDFNSGRSLRESVD